MQDEELNENHPKRNLIAINVLNLNLEIMVIDNLRYAENNEILQYLAMPGHSIRIPCMKYPFNEAIERHILDMTEKYCLNPEQVM
jgi:hypothetical protein